MEQVMALPQYVEPFTGLRFSVIVRDGVVISALIPEPTVRRWWVVTGQRKDGSPIYYDVIDVLDLLTYVVRQGCHFLSGYAFDTFEAAQEAWRALEQKRNMRRAVRKPQPQPLYESVCI